MKNLVDQKVKAILSKKDLDPTKAFVLLKKLGMSPAFIAFLAESHMEPKGLQRKPVVPERMLKLAEIAIGEADVIEQANIQALLESDDDLFDEIEDLLGEEL